LGCGLSARVSNRNIFDLEPFTTESLKLIIEAHKDVYQWTAGDTNLRDYDFNYSFFQHFSNPLQWWEIDAALSYLKACILACSVNTKKPHNEEPTLITLESATEEGKLDKYHLLNIAGEGQDTLELMVYVDYKDIVGGVAVADRSDEPGCYLTLPSHCTTRLIEKGDAYINIFTVPKAYRPSSAGLWLLKHIVAKSKDRKIQTREDYCIRIDQEKIWVVRQQAEKFYKKAPETAPHSMTQGAPDDSGQTTGQGFTQTVYNQHYTFIQNNNHHSADTNIQNIDNSVAICAPTMTINTESNTPANEVQPEQTVSPESQDSLNGNIHKQPTQQTEETDTDIIGKAKIKIECGYDPLKKNWTAIERHCMKLGIKIRHVNDNQNLDPILKKSETVKILFRKRASEKTRNKKLVARKK